MERVRVLIVDDEQGIREALTDLLVEEGFEVVGVAPDGVEGVRMAEELAPDVVMMDLRMRGMDGIRATGSIKEADPSVQVVILSAYDDRALTRSADEVGAYAYLVKGCSASLVSQVIRQAFELKKGLEEQRHTA